MDGCKTVDGDIGVCCGTMPVSGVNIVADADVIPGIEFGTKESMAEKDVRHFIENKLATFVDMVGANHGALTLDGYIDDVAKKEKSFPVSLMDAPEGFKIDNERLQASVIVSVEGVLINSAQVLINALKSFEFIKVQGVTRIVGYYSRVSNWNRSKIGELRDRQKAVAQYSSIGGHTER